MSNNHELLVFAVEWSDWETSVVYYLVAPSEMTKEEFEKLVSEASRKTARRLLRKRRNVQIGPEDVVEGVVKILVEKHGFKLIKPVHTVEFWGTTGSYFSEDSDGIDAKRMLGKYYEKLIEHNKKIDAYILSKLKEDGYLGGS